MTRLSPKTAVPAFDRTEVQAIFSDKSLRDEPTVMAIRSNYCNVLFNLYRYEEAITELKKLVLVLEGIVYPTIVEMKKSQRNHPRQATANFRQQVHMLVCNYYLLGSLR